MEPNLDQAILLYKGEMHEEWRQRILDRNDCELDTGEVLAQCYINILLSLPPIYRSVLQEILLNYDKGILRDDLVHSLMHAEEEIDKAVLWFSDNKFIQISEGLAYVTDKWFLAYAVLRIDIKWFKFYAENTDRLEENLISEFIERIGNKNDQ